MATGNRCESAHYRLNIDRVYGLGLHRDAFESKVCKPGQHLTSRAWSPAGGIFKTGGHWEERTARRVWISQKQLHSIGLSQHYPFFWFDREARPVTLSYEEEVDWVQSVELGQCTGRAFPPFMACRLYAMCPVGAIRGEHGLPGCIHNDNSHPAPHTQAALLGTLPASNRPLTICPYNYKIT